MPKKCAYCHKKGNLTKEHVIPKSIILKAPKILDVGFSAPAGNKLINGDVVIKDVCSTCNSTKLSELDDYGIKFFEDFCITESNDDSFNFSVNFEFSIFCRWLLKISYNASRASSHQDIQSLSSIRKVILDKERKIPKDISVFSGIIQPAQFTENGIDNNINPNIVRVGNFVIGSFNNQFRFLKFIQLFRIMFLIIRPIRNPKFNVSKIYDKVLISELNFTKIDKCKKSHLIPISNLDLKDVMFDHFEENMEVYGNYLEDN